MNILLTGGTGLLGGELLVTLARHPAVDHIHCLLRATDEEHARARIAGVFALHGDDFEPAMVTPVVGDLLDEGLPRLLDHALDRSGVRRRSPNGASCACCSGRFELYLRFMELGQVFDNTRLLHDTGIGWSTPAHAYIGRSLHHMDHIDLRSGALDP
jgi:hypothetical protein